MMAVEKPSARHSWTTNGRSTPADHVFLVFFFEPRVQRREVIGEGPGGETLTGRFAQHGIPVSGRSQVEDATEEVADPLVSIIITLARVLLEDIASNVGVDLKVDHRTDCIVVMRTVAMTSGAPTKRLSSRFLATCAAVWASLTSVEAIQLASSTAV